MISLALLTTSSAGSATSGRRRSTSSRPTTCAWPGPRACAGPTVIRRHGLRNALIPLVTIVAIDVGALFGGAIITERVYVWHGMGDFLNTALHAEDTNSVVGWVMVSAIFVVDVQLLRRPAVRGPRSADPAGMIDSTRIHQAQRHRRRDGQGERLMTIQPSEDESSSSRPGRTPEDRRRVRRSVTLARASGAARGTSTARSAVIALVLSSCSSSPRPTSRPHFYRWKYTTADLTSDRAVGAPRPRGGHILGTDETGFDLLARLMRGTQRDFIIIVVLDRDHARARHRRRARSPATSARSPTTC